MLQRVLRKLSPAGMEWQSIVFFMLDMKQNSTAAPPDRQPPCLEHHIIESSADQWLDILCDAFPQKQFHLRLIHDCHQCHIAVLNGHVVAYGWVSTSSCHVTEINFHLPIGPGRLYIYDCFVQPDSRGQGIYNALLLAIVARYRLRRWPARYDAVFIGAAPDNNASIRGITRAGFAEFALVRYFHLGRFSRWYGIEGLVDRMNAASPSDTGNLLSD